MISSLSIISGFAVNSFNCLQVLAAYTRSEVHMLLVLLAQGPGMDDPGTPGGDPDMPDTPLDSGVYILIIIALIYGVWRIRCLKTNPN